MRFHHVGLSVADLPALTDWYVRALGLEFEREFSVPDIDMRAAFLTGPGFRVELVERRGSSSSKPADPRAGMLYQGIYHFGVEVESIEPVFDRLVQHGAPVMFEPSDSPIPGERFAIVADPEGNFIELIEKADPEQPASR